MDSKYLQEIQAIIQNDIIQSTYKLALLRAIIEIAQESNRSKIVLNGICAYPFSLLQRKLLTYYYPLFAHPSFIPQMYMESAFPRNGRRLTIRTSMNPIIQYYYSNGGYNRFLSDLENNTIPAEIVAGYSSLIETIRRTFIAQPMKYLGNSIRPEGYTVVKYLARLPQNDNMPVTSPADPGGYYTVSQEYTRIFEDPSCARQLLDSVVQRWIGYTFSLSDTLTREELYGLFAPGSHTGTDETELQSSSKAATSLPLPASISTGYGKALASRGSLASPTSIIPALEETIRAEYAQFASQQQSIQDGSDAALKTELKLQKINESIRRLEALYDVPSQDSVSQETYEGLSQYYAEQQAAQNAYSNTMARLLASKQKISELKRERDRLQQMVQKVARDLAMRKRQQDLIDLLRRELALLDDGSGVQPRPFGYVDKPIARFLTYCSDVAENILCQCILLIPNSSERAMVKPTLPAWFLEEFDSWWRAKQDAQRRSRVSGSGTFSAHEPFLVFDECHSEVLLTIPSQSFESRDELDHVSLIIHDGSQIFYEKELPLYYQEDYLSTEEITVRVERPSQSYHVDLSVPGVPCSWVVEGFRCEDPLRFFDADTGRCVDRSRLPSKRFILLTSNQPTITPETAVLFTSRLFGDWYNFHYYIIDPIDGLSISNLQTLSDEDGRESAKLDLYIDPVCFDRHLRMDEWSVVLGSPPHLQVLFGDEEVLSNTILSIHPRDENLTSKPIFYPLAVLGEEAEVDLDEHICTVDLGHPNLLGKERVGAFTIRVRNEICRTDIRVECVFLPDISYRFSEPLYLPAEGASPVQLEITCPQSVRFEPEGPLKMETTETGFLITSDLVPRIQGILQYPTSDGSIFEGTLSISVPHAAWRFEDEAKGTIYSLQRSVLAISETKYLLLGVDPGLRIFLPESFNGVGTISMSSQDQTVTGRVTNGQGYFPLAQFNDTIRGNDEKAICFEFAMEGRRGENVAFPLFILQRWRVQLSHTPRVSVDQSGNRVIEITWDEYGAARKRFLLLWRKKESGGASWVYTGEIPASVQTFTITGNREQLLLGPGIYYIQFHGVHDDWSYPQVSFPGEKAPNIFRLLIEQNREPVPKAEVDPKILELISEIEIGDAERCSRAVEEFRKNYSVRRLEYHLSKDYPEHYERLQSALFKVITNAGMPQEIRSACVELLGNNFSQSIEYALIQALGDPDSAKPLRIEILRALSHGNTEERLNALLSSLNDPDPDIRSGAAISLGNIDRKGAVKELIKLLNDASVTVQRNAAASLGYTHSPDVLEPLISVAFDESRDAELRITAIATLARFRLKDEIVQKLFALSENEDEDDNVRKIATSVLSSLGKLEAEAKKKLIAELIQEMKTSSSGRQISAIKQLSTFSEEEVIFALMEAAGSDLAEIRKTSAESLRRINSPKAIPALVGLLDDPDDDVQEIAEFACKQLLKVLMSDLKQTSDKRATAGRHLSKMGAFAVNPLFTMLRESNSILSERTSPIEIQMAIVNALSKMDDPNAVVLIISALQDKDDLIVWGAAKALGAIGDTSAIGPLEEALAHWYDLAGKLTPMTYVWMAIKNALEQLGA